MKMNKSCYLCGNKLLVKKEGVVRDNNKLSILECTSCGLVFLSSFSHISNSFYHKSGMHNRKIDIESWSKETIVDDERRFLFLRRLIKNKSVLDFGCGLGGFLNKARDVALHTAGIEIEECLKNYLRKHGLKIFDSMENIGENFNVITLFHVLEHMKDPVGLLKEIAGKLKQDGRIIVEVPNVEDALISLYQNKPFMNFTFWSCHLFYFNQKTLVKIAELAGLKVVFLKLVQRYPLSNHLYWLAYGKLGGHKIWNFFDSKILLKAYEQQLANMGCTDTLFACFSK